MGVRRLLRGLIVTVALVAAGCGSADPDLAVNPAPSPTVGPVSSDGRGIEVVDWGFTVLSRNDDDSVTVNYGALLRNDSRRDAVVNTMTALWWLDESGAQITTAAGRVAEEDVGIAWLPPGAVMAVSGTAELSGVPVKPELGKSAFDWVPLSQVTGWGELTSDDVVVDPGDPVTIDFTLTSTFGDAIEAEVSSVLLDEDGAIVGGTSWREGQIGEIGSGQSLATITVDGSSFPKNAVAARVYAHVAYGTWTPIATG